MKAIKCDLPYAEQIEILPMADLHIGDSQCDYKLVLETIEYIKETPNAYCILDGDLMDTAIASSIGDTYSAQLQPMEQLKHCVKIFEPIKDKILAVLPGNHENRVYKSDGIDLRPQLYTVYATHGSGGGRKEGGKINRLADLASIVDADIYIHAHTHLPAVFRESFFRVSGSNSSVAQVEKLFINCASALNYGGYGDKAGFKPASKKMPVLYLNGLKHDMWAKI